MVNGFDDTQLLAGTAEDNELIDISAIQEDILAGNTAMLKSEDNKSQILITPIKDYSGVIKGYIKSVISREATLNSLQQMYSTIALTTIIGLIIAIALIYIISSSITKPVKKLSLVTDQLVNDNWDVSIDINSKDEIGQLAGDINSLVNRLKLYTAYIDEVSTLLKQLGEGNLDLEFKQTYDGNFRKLKDSLNNTAFMLKDILLNIKAVSEQVASASEQLSQGAQELSQSSAEQAGTFEKFSEKINKISDQIIQNSQNANATRQISTETNALTSRGKQQMEEVIVAMGEINDSSMEISKIAKNIDNISFQTNILALNASVEAARAGISGKGFAVVAEEVGNLASKSTESAKLAAQLVNSTLEAIKKGTKIVDDTVESFTEIFKNSQNTVNLLENISDESNKQIDSMIELKDGIVQISITVESNSATAEETAATSEDLSNQAAKLKELISVFKF